VPSRWVIAKSVFAITAVMAIAFGELVWDWRIPISEQSPRVMLRAQRSMLIADYDQLVAAMKQKYGPNVETSVPLDTGIANVTLNGKLVETRTELPRISGVYGIFVFGPDENIVMRFPFEVSAEVAEPTSNRSIAGHLKASFKKAPPGWFEFADDDWAIDQCTTRPKDIGLGIVGRALSLRGGTYCLVSWKKAQSASMLISVSVADGNPWMRPFTRRICRTITETALGRFDLERSDGPRYAACVLIDRPEYGSKSATMEAYAVGNGGKLQRIEFRRR
jgi:hypothetical protein